MNGFDSQTIDKIKMPKTGETTTIVILLKYRNVFCVPRQCFSWHEVEFIKHIPPFLMALISIHPTL